MTKPGFIQKRIKLLFESDNIEEQQKILDLYNKERDQNINEFGGRVCYCGHTDYCDCGNPGLSEFKHAINNNNIKYV